MAMTHYHKIHQEQARGRTMTTSDTVTVRESGEDMLLPELVAHLRENRSDLRQEWAGRITDAHLLSAMTNQEIFSEATSVYDNYVEVLETGSVEALQHYARDLSERIIRGAWKPTRSSGSSCSCGTCWPDL
ncbi:MAG TPA: hypothetical protein VIU11_27795, partial [Nakamurella sp.]